MPEGRRIDTGGSVFYVKPEDVAVEVGEWCIAQAGRFERTLLGAFEQVMRQERMYAAKASQFEAAFESFKRREV